ncbi:MAG: ribbon-helix-helix protein, CopG family [Chloroflexi bacterium]|nr:ribbon-helix-helix protein, CopG family [Chloroflexota bacterium]
MRKQYAPHEPEEAVLSVEDAFRDAELSAARWQGIVREQRMQQVLIELPEPMYLTLEELARRQNRTVPRIIEQVIAELLVTFVPSVGAAGG